MAKLSFDDLHEHIGDGDSHDALHTAEDGLSLFSEQPPDPRWLMGSAAVSRRAAPGQGPCRGD